MSLPISSIPDVSIPEIEIPEVSIPEIPSVSLPSVSIPSMPTIPGAAMGDISSLPSSMNDAVSALLGGLPTVDPSAMLAMDPAAIPGFSEAFSTVAFDPSALADAGAAAMNSALAAADGVRKQLDAQRAQMAASIAAADLAAMKDYTTSIADHAQDAFVTGFTSAALVPMEPSGITNPAADLLDSVSGSLSENTLTAGLMGEDNPLAGLDNDALESLAADGAGLYISSMTGGLVPPSVGASLTESVAGGVMDSVQNGAWASSLGGIDSLGPTTINSVVSGATGDMFEGTMSQTIDKLGAKYADKLSPSIWESAASSLKKFVTEPIGGLNLNSKTSFMDGLTFGAIGKAIEDGDASIFSSALDNFSKDKGLFAESAMAMACNIVQSPANISNYVSLIDNLGINLGSMISGTTGLGSTAVRYAANAALVKTGICTDEQITAVTTKLNSAIDSTIFRKIVTTGDKLARRVLPRNTYLKLDAVSSLTSMAYPAYSKTSQYNKGTRANRDLLKINETLFNGGRPIGQIRTLRPAVRLDDGITGLIRDARYILR